jgi:hypothetical protein
VFDIDTTRDVHGPNAAVGGFTAIVVVGGTAAAASQSSNVGPVLAFGAAVLAFVGALFGAWLAASSARQRQLADLAAARDRQSAALRAESDRLTLQLRHELALTEKSHLRDVLDEAARLYDRTFDVLVELTTEIGRGEHALSGREWVDKINDLGATQTKVVEMKRRLSLRFPDEHPIVAGYDHVRETLFQAAVSLPGPSDFAEGDASEADARLDEARDAFEQFCEATRPVIGPPSDAD